MALDRVAVGREAEGIDENLGSFWLGMVKSRQELVKVDRGRVRDDDFLGFRADEPGQALAELFGQSEPGGIAFEPAADSLDLPGLKDSEHRRFRPPRQRPERVAVEVDPAGRKIEFGAEPGQGIKVVEFVSSQGRPPFGSNHKTNPIRWMGVTAVSGGATRTPHPNPPPQGGRGPEKGIFTLASDSLPPCGGGLGWGARTSRHQKTRLHPVAVREHRYRA